MGKIKNRFYILFTNRKIGINLNTVNNIARKSVSKNLI